MRFPVELAIRASRRAVILIAAIHLVAAIAFLQSSLTATWTTTAVAVLGTSLVAAVRGERRKSNWRLRLDSGGFRLGDSGDPLAPLGGSTDFGWAVWLHWSGDGGRGALMLLRDNLGDEAWRTLRIWLRHQAFAGGDSAGGAPAR